MLAGDVTAKISGGDLIIKGDNLANGITIAAGASAGIVVVTGVDAGGSATNVNGTADGAVTLSGFTGKLKIDMKGGDDNVSITGITVNGKADLKGGGGNDTFSISATTFDSSLKTNLGNGNDTLTLTTDTVTDKTKIEGHEGNDTATITGSTFSELNVSLGRGNDSLSISSTTASTETELNGRSGTNTFTNGSGNSLANLTIKHFNETTTGNSDSVVLNSVSAINENSSATLTGSFTDSDVADSHTLTVNWNDPNNGLESTFTVPATSSLTTGQTITSSTDGVNLKITAIDTETGKVNFSVPHLYLNDGAPGNLTSSDNSTATVTVNGGTLTKQSTTTTITVNDVAPTVALTSPGTIAENADATLIGTITDPGLLDSQNVVIGWGDSNASASSSFAIPAIQNAVGTPTLSVNQTINSTTDSAVLTVTAIDATTGKITFSVQHLYKDDGPIGGNGTPTDTSTISASSTDSDAVSEGSSTSVTVNDIPPTVTLNQPSSVPVNGTATVTGSFTDIGLFDQHSMQINWGDGSTSEILVPAIKDANGNTALTVGQTIDSTTGSGATATTVLTITSINTTNGTVGFSATHQYTAAGNNLTISVDVLDDDGRDNSNDTSITVTTE